MTMAARPLLSAAAVLIGLTVLVAALVAVAPGLAHATRAILGFDVTAAPRAQTATAIFAHNARALLGMLLAALAASSLGRWRILLDGALIIFAAVNATAVGATLGAYGSLAAQRLIHLPLEYAALTLAAGSYLAHRHQPPRPAAIAAVGAGALTLLAAGALLEANP